MVKLSCIHADTKDRKSTCIHKYAHTHVNTDREEERHVFVGVFFTFCRASDKVKWKVSAMNVDHFSEFQVANDAYIELPTELLLHFFFAWKENHLAFITSWSDFEFKCGYVYLFRSRFYFVVGPILFAFFPFAAVVLNVYFEPHLSLLLPRTNWMRVKRKVCFCTKKGSRKMKMVALKTSN